MVVQHGGLLVEEVRLLAFGVLVAQAIRLIDRAEARLPTAVAEHTRFGYSLYAFHAPVLILLIALGAPWPIVLAAAILAAVVAFRADIFAAVVRVDDHPGALPRGERRGRGERHRLQEQAVFPLSWLATATR